MLLIPFLCLFLWVVNLGIAVGAGLYETLMMLPLWFPHHRGEPLTVNSRIMREIDPGRRFWGMITTLPLTLLTLLNLYFALHESGPQRRPWLAASALVMVERIMTFSFFIPVALKFMNSKTPAAPNVRKLVSTWISLNRVRNLLILAAWLSALYVYGMGMRS